MPKATVVSICPFETIEQKPIAKGYFKIPAAPKDDFVVLVIDESFYNIRLPATDNHIKVPVPAHHIARSIVDDFRGSVVESSDNAGPGMMWFDGELTKTEVKLKFKNELELMKNQQEAWFVNLCKRADDDWNRFHQVGLISDHQRYAAKYLNYNPDWLINYNPKEGFVDCPACYSKIDSRAIKCASCGAILNKEKALQFGLIESEEAPKELVSAKK